jgi:hypothetical protein
MKYLGVILIFFCLTSCQYFDKKKIKTDELLKQELNTVNWKEVDAYPSFAVCDSLSLKIQVKECFENTISNHIFKSLNKENIIVTEPVNDTIYLKLKISELGSLEIHELKNTARIQSQIPNIDTLLINSLSDLPAIYPATKRGQNVKTEFVLPVIIKVKN